eukprot:CAMPEP_0180287868 /NCGR_PEP_ID=MMETSP0988-20121125/13667_1 /TAXON_ID=697907 /ORGANISM="non described non described, Strain CCMP2293" /LENGTH=188 /DNA_ID=CAMNT_0022262353 /DNA_START=119 /DNA_END=686 /DNA_ORIENTATION=+
MAKMAEAGVSDHDGVSQVTLTYSDVTGERTRAAKTRMGKDTGLDDTCIRMEMRSTGPLKMGSAMARGRTRTKAGGPTQETGRGIACTAREPSHTAPETATLEGGGMTCQTGMGYSPILGESSISSTRTVSKCSGESRTRPLIPPGEEAHGGALSSQAAPGRGCVTAHGGGELLIAKPLPPLLYTLVAS